MSKSQKGNNSKINKSLKILCVHFLHLRCHLSKQHQTKFIYFPPPIWSPSFPISLFSSPPTFFSRIKCKWPKSWFSKTQVIQYVN
ncbi:hypothetical protein EUGRSUZ_E01601 [Eucalyptus grandis]|uniref:Uncharacterized protein n=2 Tax=Eucalyptus grandis TaxID=71139 RepID=A0ACC3KUD3_EUCGR|nr:hypothetical protein EUGRSUZ_E01601 [Eucalyptus grandis]